MPRILVIDDYNVGALLDIDMGSDERVIQLLRLYLQECEANGVKTDVGAFACFLRRWEKELGTIDIKYT